MAQSAASASNSVCFAMISSSRLFILADMEAMTIRLISAVPTDDGRAVSGRVRAESKARRHGKPVARISLVLLVPRDDESGFDRPWPERIYDEALSYLDIA